MHAQKKMPMRIRRCGMNPTMHTVGKRRITASMPASGFQLKNPHAKEPMKHNPQIPVLRSRNLSFCPRTASMCVLKTLKEEIKAIKRTSGGVFILLYKVLKEAKSMILVSPEDSVPFLGNPLFGKPHGVIPS